MKEYSKSSTKNYRQNIKEVERLNWTLNEKLGILLFATLIAVTITSLIYVTITTLYPPDLPEYGVDEIIVKNCSGDVIWNGSLTQFSVEYPEENKKISKQYDLHPFRGWLCGIPIVDIEITLCEDNY